MESSLNRYFIRFSFVGTAYHGWQLQPDAITVQAVMEEALGRILRVPCRLTGCGRTDAGVHAAVFYAHFDHEASFGRDECAHLVHKLNALLPEDIAVQFITTVDSAAHARFSAVSRTYRYQVLTAKDPFLHAFAWHYRYGRLDLSILNRGAAVLTEYTDFACFSKRDTDIVGTDCKLIRSDWKEEGMLLVYTVTANRFLRNMVRAIVGTLLQMGRGRWDEEKLRAILESRDRCMAGESVPACGLTLSEVIYPEGLSGFAEDQEPVGTDQA
ncbi:MAG TPA: tRNA pseudouridine synthase A [Bacteroidales bacterium]|nr:tRNA pseudouridine synthase A [Bacteroidales bacterium]HSA42402.1 tRNA pseudouridine synthase A [Bacteroidales bacterium]